jgi:hypothetical protein
MGLAGLAKTGLVMFSNILVVEKYNPIAAPALDDGGIVAWGRTRELIESFTIQKAREEAVNFWNAALSGSPEPGNFVHKTRGVFQKFQSMVKRKAFLERRIHRYLAEHARLLLPPHKKCYFEHKVTLGTESRSIDFLLEREPGMPAILVELESPVHRVFRKNREPTAETNHAKNQIAEWFSFIDRDAVTNASGEFSFMAGPKHRLVVIGRGLEDREQLLGSRFTDTTLWTYDLLLEQARERWNAELANQYKIVGLPVASFF